ncbi:hypothetical protein [Circoviridae 1 LDMD-2013]|uniref:hypothetical protein n=1 Tax=Circoviridae 1 LDMD-2013 TaxID=1379692 RepID=UPI0003844F9C|nr:hypothetical protein [Circoviridae 1 LDMD-2013]AGS36175.1 hypothetical protein [Circoviridae 1 LDMD-2013]
MSKRGYGQLSHAPGTYDEALLGRQVKRIDEGVRVMDTQEYVPLAEDADEVGTGLFDLTEAASRFGPAGLAAGGAAVGGYELYEHAAALKADAVAAEHYAVKKVVGMKRSFMSKIHEAEALAHHIFHESKKIKNVPAAPPRPEPAFSSKRGQKRLLPGGGHVVVAGERRNPKKHFKTLDSQIQIAQKILNDPAASDKTRIYYTNRLQHLAAEKAKGKVYHAHLKPLGGFDTTHAITAIGYVPPDERFWWSSNGRVNTYGMHGAQRRAAMKKGTRKSAPYHPPKSSARYRGRPRSTPRRVAKPYKPKNHARKKYYYKPTQY